MRRSGCPAPRGHPEGGRGPGFLLAEPRALQGRGWPFQVALDEALSNIVHHGLAGREGTAEIEIEFRLVGAEVEIVLADDAPPFNPLEVAEPDTARSLEERPVGGLGVALVRKLMDVVEYERREGRNQLRLRRRPLEIE